MPGPPPSTGPCQDLMRREISPPFSSSRSRPLGRGVSPDFGDTTLGLGKRFFTGQYLNGLSFTNFLAVLFLCKDCPLGGSPLTFSVPRDLGHVQMTMGPFIFSPRPGTLPGFRGSGAFVSGFNLFFWLSFFQGHFQALGASFKCLSRRSWGL